MAVQAMRQDVRARLACQHITLASPWLMELMTAMTCLQFLLMKLQARAAFIRDEIAGVGRQSCISREQASARITAGRRSSHLQFYHAPPFKAMKASTSLKNRQALFL